MTFPANDFAHDLADRWSALPLDSTGGHPVNQGDMVDWNTSGYIEAVVAGASVKFLGIAEGTTPTTSGLDKGPALGGGGSIAPLVMAVKRRGSFFLFTTASETYNPWTAVYIGADAQTITTVSMTNTQVGFVDPANFLGSSADGISGGVFGPNPFPITGALGLRIRIIIYPQYPVAELS